MGWVWIALLSTIMAATPGELRTLQRDCARGDGAACLAISIHLGATEQGYAHAARACTLDHAPGCLRRGARAEARLASAPAAARALEALLAYERGCTLGSAPSCAAASRTAAAHHALLYLSDDRQRALHDAACRAGTAEACSHLGVLTALAGPRPEPAPGGPHPVVAERRAAILACYAGVTHSRTAIYRSVVHLASHGPAHGLRVHDAGAHGACLAEVFGDLRLPDEPDLRQLVLEVAVELGPGARGLAGTSPRGPIPGASLRADPRLAALQSEVESVLDRAPVQGCVQEAAVRTRTPGGTLRVRFIIGDDGAVGSIRVSSREIPISDVAPCVADVVRSLAFPLPPPGTTIAVDHDIRFQPW